MYFMWKDILNDSFLNKLEAILPPSFDVAINLREIHSVSLAKEIDPDYQMILKEI